MADENTLDSPDTLDDEDREILQWFAKMMAPSVPAETAETDVADDYEKLPYQRSSPRVEHWHGASTMSRRSTTEQ